MTTTLLRSLLVLTCFGWSAACVADGPVAPAGAETEPGSAVVLEGIVRRFTTDQLLGGVSVRADREIVTSSGRGAYVVTGLGEGEVWISATYPGFLPYSAKQRLRPGRNQHDIDLVPETGR